MEEKGGSGKPMADVPFTPGAASSSLSGIPSIDTTATLNDKYKDNEPCKWSARLAVGALGVDALNGTGKAGSVGTKLETWLDFGAEVQMMRCLGMSAFQIVAFYAMHFVVVLIATFAVQVTSDHEREVCTVKDKGSKNRRPGTPEECRAEAWITDRAMGFLLGMFIVFVLRTAFSYYLHFTIFKIKYAVGNMLLRAFV